MYEQRFGALFLVFSAVWSCRDVYVGRDFSTRIGVLDLCTIAWYLQEVISLYFLRSSRCCADFATRYPEEVSSLAISLVNSMIIITTQLTLLHNYISLSTWRTLTIDGRLNSWLFLPILSIEHLSDETTLAFELLHLFLDFARVVIAC